MATFTAEPGTAHPLGITVYPDGVNLSLFSQAATSLGAAGLSDESAGFRRLIIEKPFGTSLDSAVVLQQQLREVLQRMLREDPVLAAKLRELAEADR